MALKKLPDAPKIGIDGAPSKASLGYQSGFEANAQAVNSGQGKANFLKESLLKSPISSQDGQRGIEDIQRGMQANSVSQLGRGYAAQNAQQSANDMATRSQLTQQGLANQAQIYQDMNKRAVDQMGLAAKLNEALIRSKGALIQNMADKKRFIGSNPLGDVMEGLR